LLEVQRQCSIPSGGVNQRSESQCRSAMHDINV
jgi:hypothetical protein